MMYADELRLCAIAAFSATSRAMLAGDLNRWDAQETATGFHEGVFDWLYFKGKTIRLVNERLRDTKQAAADSTVEGIVDLILLEVSLLTFCWLHFAKQCSDLSLDLYWQHG